jgi:hypothetical protein
VFHRQNPDFQYLFEAGRGFSEEFVSDNCSPTPKNPEVKNIIKATFNCNFTVLKSYNELQSWKGHLYSWERTSAFSGKEKTNLCLPPNNKSPKARSVSVALKEIEMWAPKLNWLHETLGAELHVIWLVRDVRGWVSSWLLKGEKESFYKEWGYEKLNLWKRYEKCEIINNGCGGILDQAKLAQIKDILNNASSAPHLKMAAWWTIENAVSFQYFSGFTGNALLVKYEDLASQPFGITQQIYAYLGRPHVPEKVLRYLVWATKGGNVGDRYTTYRKSNEMAKVWQTRLTKEQIQEIQDIAGVLFPYFGYEI